jgi:hypothetical protein
VRQELTRSLRGDDLGVTLVKKGQGSPRCAGIDSLPQSVEHKNRLIEHCIHDLGEDMDLNSDERNSAVNLSEETFSPLCVFSIRKGIEKMHPAVFRVHSENVFTREA